MFCFVTQRLLSLYLSDDLPHRLKKRTARHIHTCRRCRVEFNRLQALQNRFHPYDPSLPAGLLDGFAEETMSRILRLQTDAGEPQAVMSFSMRPGSCWMPGRRLVMAMLLVVLALFAFARREASGIQGVERSVVTANGLIVSNAHLHGRAADVKVIQVDHSDMVVIWLKSASAPSDPARRG